MEFVGLEWIKPNDVPEIDQNRVEKGKIEEILIRPIFREQEMVFEEVQIKDLVSKMSPFTKIDILYEVPKCVDTSKEIIHRLFMDKSSNEALQIRLYKRPSDVTIIIPSLGDKAKSGIIKGSGLIIEWMISE